MEYHGKTNVWAVKRETVTKPYIRGETSNASVCWEDGYVRMRHGPP